MAASLGLVSASMSYNIYSILGLLWQHRWDWYVLLRVITYPIPFLPPYSFSSFFLVSFSETRREANRRKEYNNSLNPFTGEFF